MYLFDTCFKLGISYHSKNTAFISQKSTSWAISNLCLGYPSTLLTRNYQYPKMTEMGEGSTSSMMVGTGCGSDSILGAGTSEKYRPSLRHK